MSARQQACLNVLLDQDQGPGYGFTFSYIARGANLTEREARLAVRALRRMGLVEHERGLFSEHTGMLCGSGHGLTERGRQWGAASRDGSS